MKKKVLAILFAILLVATSLVALAACEDKKNDDYVIEYGKKYILSSDLRAKVTEQHYFIFYRNNTCKYHYYSTVKTPDNEVLKFDYTADYIFTFVDNDNSSVAFFYDNITDHSTYTDVTGLTCNLKESLYWKNNSHLYVDYLPDTDQCGLITVSKNVLCTVGSNGYAFFVNEDYVSKLPNFATKTEEN